MDKKIKHLSCLLVFIMGFAIISCSDNSTSSDEDNAKGHDLGELSLTVSGYIQDNHSGQADFEVFSSGGIDQWIITAHDFGPQTFSLDFTIDLNEPVEYLDTGTYKISASEDFRSSYLHIENEDYENAVEYGINRFCPETVDQGGGLVITSSSSDEVKGTFNATLLKINDDNPTCDTDDTVTITGEFRATPVVSF